MTAWTLVADLASLRAEFDTLAPERDKVSDGSIGNAAHAAESSDHNPDETGNTPTKDADDINEVHAIDVDDDLHKPGWTMDRCVAIIVTRHRTGLDNRLQNVIYNRRIWSRSWGWTARAYTGASAHTEHAHFSSRYGSGSGSGNPENDVRPWGLLLEEEDVALTPDDLKAVRLNAALGWYDALWSAANGVDVNGVDYEAVGRPIKTNLQKLTGGPVDQAAITSAISSSQNAVIAAIQAGVVDPAPIVAGLLAVLTPEAIAAAIPDSVATAVVDKLAARIQS